jgi:hypothetical protein
MHHESEDRAATDRISDATEQVRQTASEHPLTTLMFVGAAAFAVGALWKSGRRTPSRLERMRAQMPDMDTLSSYLPKDYMRYIPKDYARYMKDYLPRSLR